MSRNLNLKKGDKCIMAVRQKSTFASRLNIRLDNIDKWTWEVEVVSIGRKYVTVKRADGSEYKFDIEKDYIEKSNTSPDYVLYQKLQEVYDIQEYEELSNYIRRKINNMADLNLDQLKRIKSIIEEK